MKLRKQLIFLFAAFWICISAATVFWMITMQSGAVRGNPLRSEFSLRYPYRLYGDLKGNRYLIDNGPNGYKRLIRIAANGTIGYILEGGNRSNGALYNCHRISPDRQGTVYASNVVINRDDGNIERSEVLIFGPDGEHLGTPVRIEYPKDVRDQFTTRYTLSSTMLPYHAVDGDYLYFWHYDDPESLVLYRQGLKSQVREKLMRLPLTEMITDIAGHEPGRIYFCTSRGRLYRIAASGAPEEIRITSRAAEAANPFPLLLDQDGSLLFNDLLGQRLMRVRGTTVTTELQFNTCSPSGLVTYFDVRGGKALVVFRDRRTLAEIDLGSGAVNELHDIRFSPAVRLVSAGFWLALVSAAGITLFGAWQIFVTVADRRVPLLLKNIAVPAVFMVAGIIAIGVYVQGRAEEQVDRERENRFLAMAGIASRTIDGGLLGRINSPADIDSPAFKELSDQMKALVNSDELWNTDVLIYLYRKFGDYFYLVDKDGYDFLYPYPVPADYAEVFKSGITRSSHYSDENGEWVTAAAPLRNKKGEITGIVEIGANQDIKGELRAEVRHGIMIRTGVALALLIAALAALTAVMLSSIKKLRNLSREVASNNYNVEIAINSHDEIEDLGRSFNQMAQQIKSNIEDIGRYTARIEELRNANARFVPVELLSHLEKPSIVEVKLGDQVNRTMTIMFTDIRNFTALSEKMTPAQNFRFLNSYLSRFGPIVREHNGFVDKYIGDCIMALFPSEPDCAIRAGVAMRRALKDYNLHRIRSGYDPLAIGIGVHTGEMMLGIIGEHQRFEGTVISDSVNLASRLETLTKFYQTGMIVSSNTILGANQVDDFNYRFIDYVKVKGKNEPVLIYEIYDEDDDRQIELKTRSKDDLQDAIQSLIKGDVAHASSVFARLKALNPDDGVIDVYLRRCDDFISRRVPEEWVGVAQVDF